MIGSHNAQRLNAFLAAETTNQEAKMKKSRSPSNRLLVAVLSVSFLFVGALSLQAADKVVIKVTTVQLPKQQMGKGAAKLAEMVKKELGDKVEMKVYPAAQLYGGDEEMTALSRGEIQMAFIISSKLETLDSAFQAFKIPFLYPNIDVAYKALDSKVGDQLFDRLAKHNYKSLGIFHSGNVLVANNKHPIVTPEDFKGLKLRSFGRMGKDTLEILGAQAVVTASEETYSAIQQGVIDGMSVPNSVFLIRKFDTVQKYVTDAGMMNFTSGLLLVNKDFWDKLPSDIKPKLKSLVDEVISDMREEMKADNDTIIKAIAAKGVNVTVLTPAQVAVFKKALKGVSDKYAPEIGPELLQTFEDLVAQLSK